MNLFIDIETIGTSDPAVIAEIEAGIEHPGNISKPETIAAWKAEKRPAMVEAAIKCTAFDSGLGHIICFGYAIDDAVPGVMMDTIEANLLANIAAIKMGHGTQVIGHNVAWDLRFLWQRFVVCNIPAPTWLRQAVRAKPWDIADTMTMWNPDRDRKVSLEKLCRILGILSPKTEFDGSKVWDAYKAGQINEIATYCCGDVSATRECYRRMVQ